MSRSYAQLPSNPPDASEGGDRQLHHQNQPLLSSPPSSLLQPRNARHRASGDDNNEAHDPDDLDDDEQHLIFDANRSYTAPENHKMGFMISIATCVSSLGGFLFGYDAGVIAGILIAPSFQKHFNIDPNNKVEQAKLNGTIVALLQIGCLVGALAANWFAGKYSWRDRNIPCALDDLGIYFYLTDKIGRKWTIVSGSSVFIVGGVLQTIGGSLAMIREGRLVAGLGVGMLSMTVPVFMCQQYIILSASSNNNHSIFKIYIAEIAPKNLRGRLGGLWQFFIVTGITASYWVNYVAKRTIKQDDNLLWRIPLGIQITPGILLALGMLPMLESPRWLCAQGRIGQAMEVLARLRSREEDDPEVWAEVDDISKSVKEETERGKTKWREVWEGGNKRRLLIGCGLQFFQQMTGTNIINYYVCTLCTFLSLIYNHAYRIFKTLNISRCTFILLPHHILQSPTIFKSIGLSSDEADLLATGFYGIVKMVATLAGTFFLADPIGRRPLLILGGVGMGACMFIVATCVKVQVPEQAGDAVSLAGYVGITFIYRMSCLCLFSLIYQTLVN
ncbi:hypothetical protein BC937DRAFT_91925 [Endogone sp. FLAS-F59071]|nr:hypothetical protein BC937DRAFT_91925 [Endogone sp. FLAS-F59071]|eukprot:RUS15836.1 hypothetical protein BC937DRAFT_91925 [Endogone sp. FLAS-F59071]